MGGWLDRWIKGWVHEWMDGSAEAWLDSYERIDGQEDEGMSVRNNKWMSE